MNEIKFRAWTGKKIIDCKIFSEGKGFKDWRDFEVYHGYTDVMQFTGLKDKNGKEIYEGDIVENKEGTERAKVIWDNELSGYSVKCIFPNPVTGIFTMITKRIDSNNVIGNIYENPELLEGGWSDKE